MKLTNEQKAANKEASLLRQAAYRARVKEFEQAKLEINVAHLEAAAEAARDKEDAALAARNNNEDAIREQIALLEAKFKSVRETHDPVIEAARQARISAYEVLHKEKQKQIEKVEKRFPDLKTRLYMISTNWIPPNGYLEKYASDNREEIAKKKARRTKQK